MRQNLFVPNKMPYAKGKNRPDVTCILCAIVEKNEKVERLEVHRTELFTISLNLYPYSPGHLLIFPNRHIIDARELCAEEVLHLHKLQCLSFEVLTHAYQPRGFNVGLKIVGNRSSLLPYPFFCRSDLRIATYKIELD